MTAVRKAPCQALDTRDGGGGTPLYEKILIDRSVMAMGEDVRVVPSSWDHVHTQRGAAGLEMAVCQTHTSAMLSVFCNSVIQTLPGCFPMARTTTTKEEKRGCLAGL